MKLQAFNGGVSSRLAPHLIGINEAVVYNNIDSESASLVPLKKKLDLSQVLLEYSHYFNAISEWVTSAINRDYVEYRNTLYYTQDSTYPMKTDDNITFNRLGIVAPASAVSVATGAAGTLTGTYQYLITFYNNNDGTESAPSPLSAEVTPASQQVDISSIPVSSDSQVTHKRIYRVGGNLTAFTLVDTIGAADSTYVDNIADTDVEGTLLESTYYNEAPTGLKYLVEHYGIFMGALDDKVYFTPIGKPNAWPATYYIDFDSNVTGIGKVLNGILVFTQFKTYIITGTNINSLVKNTLSTTQGCKEHKSIQYISEGQALWVSNDGICSSVGSRVEVISKPKLGKINLSPVNAVVHDEVYYLQKSDKTLFIVDTRYGLIFRDAAHDTTRLVVANDILYGYNENNLFQLYADSTDEGYSWKSPVLTEGSYTNLKQYKSVFIRAVGTAEVKIYIDDVLVLTKSISGTATHHIKINQDLQDGYSIQFEINGTATIHEIEYKALPKRTN